MQMDFKPQQPPALEHDAMMLERFKQEVSANGRIERRIAWNLLMWLEQHGWHVSEMWDGEEDTKLTSAKQTMELLFNLDEAHIYVRKSPKANPHRIYIVLGNGTDIVADNTYTEGDPDGFSKLMDDFDAEFVSSVEAVEECLTTELATFKAEIIRKVDHAIAMGDLTSCLDMLQHVRALCNR
jgi:hypothetical protein